MERLLKPERFEGSDETRPEEWTHWLRTFGNFLQSFPSDSPPDKLKLLVNYISPAVFTHIADSATYDDAINILKSVYVKPRNVVFSRHQLATRRQLQSETIDFYLQSLKLLARDCDFKAVTADTYCQEAIRDSFIAGLTSPVIRQRLLEKESLSLHEAVQLARSLDTAQRNAEKYSLPAEPGQQTAAAAEKMVAASNSRRSCYFCGGKQHPRSLCPARATVCHACGKAGHFAKVCKSGRTVRPAKSAAAVVGAGADVSLATAAPLPRGIMAPPCDYYSALAPPAASATPVLATAATPRTSTVPVSVNDRPVNALIDSGSTISFINPETLNRLKIPIHPSQDHITLAASQISTTHGHCFADLKVNDKLYPKFKLCVLPRLCSTIILGQDFMNLHKSVEFALNGSLPKLTVCGVACMKFDPPSLFPNLTQDVKPISTQTRKFTKSDAVFIHDEIVSLLREGIIELSQSPWRAQVLVTSDERHRRRMVIDYSRTINRFTQLDAYPIPRINDLVHKMAKYRVFSKIDLKSAYYQVPLRENEKHFTAFEAEGQLFQFTRVPFGLTNSVAVFQRVINSIISDNGLEATFAYLDDVIICGDNKEDHDRNLQRFKDVALISNLTLNIDKCQYGLSEITYLGYCITNGTLRPDPDRIKPLLDLPAPIDSRSLKRTLGLFSYYSIWIPNYSLRVQPLLNCQIFPLSSEEVACFQSLKKDISEASVAAFDDSLPLQIETDASSVSLAAVLSQHGRPVAFFSRTLNNSEKRQSAVEREAAAIVEAVRKWRLFVIGRKFTIVTDQQAVSLIFSSGHSSKIKNDKLLRWRLELSEYQYDIHYRPGVDNVVCDTLSRVCSVTALADSSLEKVHVSLCHPGVTRLYHYVKMTNLPFSLEDVRRICSQCSICSELKPRFFKPPSAHLIKALKPFDRISIDFAGPKISATKNKYLLVMVDEYSRFPFAFPCSDLSSQTVISCFRKLISLFGCPSSVHSDRGTQFMSREVSEFLHSHGIVMTHSTPYHPQGNGQCEREIGTIWKSVCLALMSMKLPISHWEQVLDTVLYSIRTLLCTSTNQTPHERLFSYPRNSSNGYSLPTWLTSPGPVLLRKFVRQSKNAPLVEHVELENANPHYARIRYPDGRTSTVSTKDLAPLPRNVLPAREDGGSLDHTMPEDPSPDPPTCALPTSDRSGLHINADSSTTSPTTTTTQPPAQLTPPSTMPDQYSKQSHSQHSTDESARSQEPAPLRRSTRVRNPPNRLNYY